MVGTSQNVYDKHKEILQHKMPRKQFFDSYKKFYNIKFLDMGIWPYSEL